MKYMDNKFKNLDLETIMKIARTRGETKVGSKIVNKETDIDSVQSWMKKIDLKEGGVKVLSNNLYKAYNNWLKDNEGINVNSRMFGRILSKLLHKTKTPKGNAYFCNFNPLESVTNDKEKEK